MNDESPRVPPSEPAVPPAHQGPPAPPAPGTPHAEDPAAAAAPAPPNPPLAAPPAAGRDGAPGAPGGRGHRGADRRRAWLTWPVVLAFLLGGLLTALLCGAGLVAGALLSHHGGGDHRGDRLDRQGPYLDRERDRRDPMMRPWRDLRPSLAPAPSAPAAPAPGPR